MITEDRTFIRVHSLKVEKPEPYERQHGEQRICPLCGNSFDLELKNNKGTKRQFCYDCLPLHENKRNSALRKSLKRLLIEYKGGHCEICGFDGLKHPAAMHFHHNDPNDKEFCITEVRVTKNIDMRQVYAEADKCALLCANCHAIAHDEASWEKQNEHCISRPV